MTTIKIFVATVTGNAELVAEDITDGLNDEETNDGSKDHQALAIDIALMDQSSLADLMECTLAIVVSSTYGVGDVPDNSIDLFTEITRTEPDLSHLRYGAVTLGDSTYSDTFAFGGRKWDALLTGAGAERIGELLVLDASSNEDPQDLAIQWAVAWRALL